jgi:hypothetical protein
MRELSEASPLNHGIDPSVLSQLEHGHRLPRPHEMKGLERAYGPADRWYMVELVEVPE